MCLIGFSSFHPEQLFSEKNAACVEKKDFDMIVFCTRQLKPYRFARLLVCLCKRLRFSLTNATLSCITLLGKMIHILERQTATKLFLTLHMFIYVSFIRKLGFDIVSAVYLP